MVQNQVIMTAQSHLSEGSSTIQNPQCHEKHDLLALESESHVIIRIKFT